MERPRQPSVLPFPEDWSKHLPECCEEEPTWTTSSLVFVRNTPRLKNKKEGTAWIPAHSFYLLYWQVAMKSREIRDATRARLCGHFDYETVEEKGQNCLFTTFPNQTNSLWFLKQEFCLEFLCSPYSHWQLSHGYKILCRSKIKLKGQHEKIIYYLHERILKSSSKEN